MPNWCENDLTIRGPQAEVQRFLDHVRGEELIAEGKRKSLAFDFNRLVPMPPELRDVESGSWDLAYKAEYGSDQEVAEILSRRGFQRAGVQSRAELVAFLQQKNPQYLEIVDKYKRNQEKYGHPTWYSWTWTNWGTEWNASSDSVRIDFPPDKGKAVIHFDTKWSPPLPVIVAASAQFPQLRFTLRYYEAGNGFKGLLKAKAGKAVEDSRQPYSGRRGG